MAPDTSATRLWPTPVGGNVSVFYDLPSVTTEGNLDSLWGTLGLLVRAAQANWAFSGALSAPAQAAAYLSPLTPLAALLADLPAPSLYRSVEAHTARFQVTAPASLRV